MAQIARLAITVAAMALAGWAWFAMGAGAPAWVLASAIFLVGGAIAELAFRRLASAEAVRADLEERVRNSG
jgi:hypothetical protein